MSKSSGGGLFGSPRTGAITLVETPVSRVYARKARLTYYLVATIVALLTTVILHLSMPLAASMAYGIVAGIVCGLAAGVLVVAWPVLRVVWHWATETTLAVVLVTVWSSLAGVTGGPLALLVLAVAGGVPFAFRATRRRILAWVWCVIVRHRLRVCFAEFIRTPGRSTSGRGPLILATRPTPAGERVWVWLRAGLDLVDLEGKAGKLAVACWASQVVAVRTATGYAALIRIDITRRDPLTATIASPLIDLIPHWRTESAAPVSPGLPPLGLDLPDVPEPSPAAPAAARTRPTAARRPAVVPVDDDNPYI